MLLGMLHILNYNFAAIDLPPISAVYPDEISGRGPLSSDVYGQLQKYIYIYNLRMQSMLY